MLLTSIAESIAFFLGALTSMPAVRLFSLYAAVSVLIDFFLQITVFISLITLDHKRTIENRIDVCCCLQIPHDKTNRKSRRFRLPKVSWFKPQTTNKRNNNDQNLTVSKTRNPFEALLTSTKADDAPENTTCQSSKIETCKENSMKIDGFLFGLFKHYYAPFIMNGHVRPIVMFLFFTWFTSSIALLPYIKIGLEQNITMPRDSYMIDYFAALKEYFAVGPPVHFVIKSGK